jgi:alpha-N-arabinofuranosidase
MPLETIRPSLLGLDLEFTRHDVWEGLSAELLANRLFALQPPGTSWPQRWPSGFPPRWASLPNGTAPAVGGPFSAVTCALSPSAPLCGVQQLPVGDGFAAGLSWGSAIGVEGGRGYTFRAVVKVNGTGGAGLTLNVALAPAVFSATLTVPETGGWVVVEAAFIAPATVSRADALSLWVSGTEGSLTLNATSLLPDDHWLGMRRDVVDALRDLAFPGPLRYPGGCFAPFYKWKAALADRLSRAPMFSPPNYCPAIAGGVNTYSDGFLENGPNIDEYIALAARVGATPAVTVPLQFGTPEEIEDARDLVEYVNGDASAPGKPWAALRAARGHAAPYGIKVWYMGNEIGWQARFPDYPAQPNNHTSAASGPEYATMLEALMPALLAADPSLTLLAVSADDAFNKDWLNTPSVTPFVGAASVHIGYANSDGGGSPASPAAATVQAKLPHTSVLPQLVATRAMLDAGAGWGSHVRISLDEWGLGPPWMVQSFNTAHALFGASFLTMALNAAEANGVQFTNYFEPINEGAIQVLQFSSTPTPLGVVMPLFGALAGATRLAAVDSAAGGDDDVVAVAAAAGAPGAATLTLLLTNRNATAGYTQYVRFDGQAVAATANVELLQAINGSSAGSFFTSSAAPVPVNADGWAAVALPPYSVARVTVLCFSC